MNLKKQKISFHIKTIISILTCCLKKPVIRGRRSSLKNLKRRRFTLTEWPPPPAPPVPPSWNCPLLPIILRNFTARMEGGRMLLCSSIWAVKFIVILLCRCFRGFNTFFCVLSTVIQPFILVNCFLFWFSTNYFVNRVVCYRCSKWLPVQVLLLQWILYQ